MAAVEAGADAIGLVFYRPAHRYVEIATAQEILAALPPFITPVGLFVNSKAKDIKDIAGELRLNHIQLHGEETEETVAELAGYSVLKSVPADRQTLGRDIDQWKSAVQRRNLSQLKGFVLETPNTGSAGGSGVENNWSLIVDLVLAGRLTAAPVLIAAGGLNAENVGEVVRRIHPYAVDVSSGVESSPGKKSAEKIRAFISAVRAAE